MIKNSDVSTHDLQTFNLVSTLISIINKNNDTDMDFILADYFLKHLEDLESISIYEIADACYTSRSSVQRFIKDIGFESYNKLKSKTQEVLRHNRRYLNFYRENNFKEIYRKNINNMMDNFDKFYNSEHIDYFVDLLHISDKIVFSIAEGSSVAPFDFQEALVSLHKNVRVITNSTKNMELLLSLKETDTLITLSMTGNYALATLNEIEKSKSNKVLITLNHSTIFNEVYDKVIHFTDDNSSRDYIQDGVRNAYTIYGFNYLFDLILNRYFEKYND